MRKLKNMLTLASHGNNVDGLLRFLDFKKIDFSPKRIFWVSGVPAGTSRGHHGHYHDQQQLFCIKGKILVSFYSNTGEEKHLLEEGDSCFMDKMIWSEQTYMTGADILMVLCSEEFDKEDYFYDKQEVHSEKLLHCN